MKGTRARIAPWEGNPVEPKRLQRPARPRHTLAAAVALAAVALAAPVTRGSPTPRQTTYGYRRGEDPLVRNVRALVADAREQAWDRALADVERLAPQITDLRKLFGIDLRPQLGKAIESRELPAVLDGSLLLVYLAIVEKFVSNEQEELKDRLRGKERLRLAEEYYTTILSGNVHRFDRERHTGHDKRIRDAFAAARHALGNPGMLGIGGWKADPGAFAAAKSTIRRELRAVFPNLPDAAPRAAGRRDEAPGSEGHQR